MSEIIRKHRTDALYAEDVGDCSYLSILVETLKIILVLLADIVTYIRFECLWGVLLKIL